jgi:hypothetical protein
MTLRHGFEDCYEESGQTDVYFATTQLDINDGVEGDVTLCLDIPDEIFDEFECTDEIQEASGYRFALIPTPVLNRLGPPQVYDHYYAGSSRRELLTSIRHWGDDHPMAKEMRKALKFFDRIGWLTPLKLKEQLER